jgi:uncharacterized glyoxalase superfamily protein PhnB
MTRYAKPSTPTSSAESMTDSTPTAPNIYPYLRYSDADAALKWLARAFGFVERAAFRGPDGAVAHAEMGIGPGVILLGPAGDGDAPPSPRDPRMARQGIYVHVDDVDAHYARAREAGAEIVTELEERRPGEREYYARDLEGYHWTFGTYRPTSGA